MYETQGPSLSPFNAWNMIKGLETLSLRVEKQCDNAQKLAEFLENLAGIDKVLYPGAKIAPPSQTSNTTNAKLRQFNGDLYHRR